MVWSEDNARARFATYEQTFVECVKAAWQHWRDLAPDVRYRLGKRSRACMLYDFICHEARHRFADVASVNICTINSMLVLDFAGEAVIRFKKLDDAYRSSNVNTRHQEAYTLQLELPGLPPKAVRLTVGYQLDPLDTDLKDIQITHPLGRDVLWHYSILDRPQSDTLDYPQPTARPIQPTTPPRVRAKRQKPSNE